MWVCIGGTGSLHAKEGRDQRQEAFRNSSPLTSTLQPLVFLILWNGRIHAQLFLVAPLLETLCLDSFAEVLLPLGEASGKPRAIALPEVYPGRLGCSSTCPPGFAPSDPGHLEDPLPPSTHSPVPSSPPHRDAGEGLCLHSNFTVHPCYPTADLDGVDTRSNLGLAQPQPSGHPGPLLKSGLTSAALMSSAGNLLKKSSSRKDL